MGNISYRITRNIETSIKQWLEEELEDAEWKCRVEKDFSDAYKGTLPCITINADRNLDKRLQVGSNQLSNLFELEMRLFCKGDGFRKDLRDWILSKIMNGISYYEYVINNDTNEIHSKTKKGRISIGEILDNRKEFTFIENLAKEDRYRHLLRFAIRIVFD